jgi:hypothetical protein
MAGDRSSEDEEEDDVAGWETAAASPRRTIQIVATEAGGAGGAGWSTCRCVRPANMDKIDCMGRSFSVGWPA